MVAIIIALAALALTATAEWLHARRVRRVAYLAFGSSGRPRPWTAATTLLRAASAGSVAWGLVTLLSLGAALREPTSTADDGRLAQHLVIALDVSPSMNLGDAGPQGNQSRGERAREVLRSVLERLDSRRMRVSVVAFYSDARPVVVDTFDPEVTANILADLPLEHAFQGGQTNLYAGVQSAGELAKAWRERSASLLVVSDGDTLPPREAPTLPRAYANVLVLGVGSPQRGTFIDGHNSRQDAASLERLATRLGGRYQDANVRHVPSDIVGQFLASSHAQKQPRLDLRRAALLTVAAGSLVLALLPVFLALAGTGHRPWKLQHRLAVFGSTNSSRAPRLIPHTSRLLEIGG
jgi:Ca-activated chloride channel family protein